MTSIKASLTTGLAALAALTLVSCSSSGGAGGASTGPGGSSSPSSPPPSSPPPSSNAPTSGAGTSTASEAGSLTGKWAGNYSGAFTGTFTLDWTQTGSKLSGTINLSTAGKLPLNGSVNGGQITFGTVGSTVITYTGSVSGDSMSGQYQIAGGTAGTGSWSAHRAA